MSWNLQNQVDQNAQAGFYKSIYETAVMRALASFADDEGRCFPSLVTLALRSQCNERTVQRVLKRFRQNNWITVKRTGRSNQYRILEHGCVLKREVTETLQIGQAVVSERTQCRIRDDTVANESHQGTLSGNLIKEPPPKPPKGVVVVFDFEEEEVTKEKTLKDSPPFEAGEPTRHSFVTPPLGKKARGDAPRLESATRGGGLEDGCGAGQPDAAPYTLEGVSALARELGLSRSEGRDIYQGWVNGEFHNPLAIVRHRAKNEAAREAARKTRWERYTHTDAPRGHL